MTIIADQQADIRYALDIRYAVHIWRGDAKIGETEPTTDQAEARETVASMRHAFPDSVLVVQSPADGVWGPVSDEMLDRLAAQKSALVLADLIGKAPVSITWSLGVSRLGELSGHAFKRDVIESFATWLKVDVVEERSDDHVMARASGTYLGVPVEVYRVSRIEQAAPVTS